jgi:hypothetical protein
MSRLRALRRAPSVEPLAELALVRENNAARTSSPSGLNEQVGIAATFSKSPFSNMSPARAAGTVSALIVTIGNVLFAAGESIVLQVRQNGVLIGSTFTLNSTLAKGTHDFSASLGAVSVVAGDVFSLDGTYTAGGGPANPTFSVAINY